MRLSNAFYVAAPIVLVAWLVLVGLVRFDRPGGAYPGGETDARLSAVSAPPAPPRHTATAFVDGRSYLIFVGRTPHVWSFAVGEDDRGPAVETKAHANGF